MRGIPYPRGGVVERNGYILDAGETGGKLPGSDRYSPRRTGEVPLGKGSVSNFRALIARVKNE